MHKAGNKSSVTKNFVKYAILCCFRDSCNNELINELHVYRRWTKEETHKILHLNRLGETSLGIYCMYCYGIWNRNVLWGCELCLNARELYPVAVAVLNTCLCYREFAFLQFIEFVAEYKTEVE